MLFPVILGLVVGAGVDPSDPLAPSEFTRTYPPKQNYTSPPLNYDSDNSRGVPLRVYTPFDNDQGKSSVD